MDKLSKHSADKKKTDTQAKVKIYLNYLLHLLHPSVPKHLSPFLIPMSTMWSNNLFIAFLILDLIGLVLNASTMVYIQTTFDIKKHVFLLIFIDASVSTICAGVSSIIDAVLFSGYKNYPTCFIMVITNYLPCSYGALLTLLIAFIRYDLAKKAAKNIINSNREILGRPLLIFIAFASAQLSYFLLCLLMDIPFSYFFDECTSPQRETRYWYFSIFVLQCPNLFNLTSVIVDILLIRFIQKTLIPSANLGISNAGEYESSPLI
jgi:hypothetical protein